MQQTVKHTKELMARNNKIIEDVTTQHRVLKEHAYLQNKRLEQWLKDFISGKTHIGYYV